MAKNKDQKKQIISAIKEKVVKSKSIIFVEFRKLGVKDNEELRKALKQEGSEYLVSKKTLIDVAFKEADIKAAAVREMQGQTALVFGYEDEVAPARIVDKFKQNKDKEEKIFFLGGIVENKFLTAAEVSNLAKLPSKQELYAKLVGSINAPISGFVNVLAGNLRGLVNVLKAIEQKASSK